MFELGALMRSPGRAAQPPGDVGLVRISLSLFLAILSSASPGYGEDTIPLPTRSVSVPERRIGLIRAPIRFDSIALENTPGTGSDLNRVLATDASSQTSGVLSENSLSVRGGRIDENLYVLNGMEFPNLDHFSIGSEGAFGFISAATLRNVELHAGTAPGELATSASSVIQVDTRSGNPSSYGAAIDISVTGGEAVVEGPSGIQSGTFLSQLRYLDFRPLRDWVTTGQIPRFFDGTLCLDLNHSGEAYSRIFGLFTWDTMSTDLAGAYDRADRSGRAGLSYAFHRLSGKFGYDAGLSALRSSKSSTWSPDTPIPGISATSFSEAESDGRAYLTVSIGSRESSRFTTGADMKISVPELQRVSIGGEARDTSVSNMRGGAFMEYAWVLGRNGINLGLRAEYFSLFSALGLSPQAGVSRLLGDSCRLSLDASLRSPPQGQLADLAAFALLDESHPPYDMGSLPLARVWYLDASFAARRKGVKYEITGYAKLYDREFKFVDGRNRAYYGGSESDRGQVISVFADPSGIRTVEGLELKANGTLGNRLRYSLSMSLIDIEDEYLDGEFRPDRDGYAISGKGAGYWSFSRNQMISLSMNVCQGRPYWSPEQIAESRFYSERFPPIAYLSARYALDWNWGRTRLSAFFEADNVLNQTPEAYQEFTSDGGYENRALNGIFPLIGVKAAI